MIYLDLFTNRLEKKKNGFDCIRIKSNLSFEEFNEKFEELKQKGYTVMDAIKEIG